MLTTFTAQLELDLETDTARLGRIEWRRALEADLHAIRDYVSPRTQLIIWQPGIIKRKGHAHTERGALQVEIATSDTCSCSRFRLKDRCEHLALVRALERSGHPVGTDTPVAARSLEG